MIFWTWKRQVWKYVIRSLEVHDIALSPRTVSRNYFFLLTSYDVRKLVQAMVIWYIYILHVRLYLGYLHIYI